MGRTSAGDALDGGIEVVERLGLDDLRADLATDTEGREATLHNDETARYVNKSCSCRIGIGRTG